MSRNFTRYRSSDPTDPWFRVGTVFVDTTTLVTAILVITSIVASLNSSFALTMALFPRDVLQGYVWKIFTWPLVNEISFFGLLSFFFFWWFGSALEKDIGRFRMMRLLLWLTVTLGLLAVGLGSAFSGALVLAGLHSISTIVLLLYIAERPGVKFFFGIPGWVIAGIIFLLDLLQSIRLGTPYFLHFIIGLLAAALIAKACGLLVMYDAVPNLNPRGSGAGRPRKKKAPKGGPATVTQGPWAGSSAVAPPRDPRKAAIEDRLDTILDKISDSGMDSLSPTERDELMRLRDQLRGS